MAEALPLWASEVALGLLPEIRDLVDDAEDDYALVLGIRSLLAEAATRGYARAGEERQVLAAVDNIEADAALQRTWVGRALFRVREALDPLVKTASGTSLSTEKLVAQFRKLLEEVARTRAAILSELDTEPDDSQESPPTPPQDLEQPESPAPVEEETGAGPVLELEPDPPPGVFPEPSLARPRLFPTEGEARSHDDPAFREEVAECAIEHGAGAASDRYNVSYDTVLVWRDELLKDRQNAPPQRNARTREGGKGGRQGKAGTATRDQTRGQ